MGSPRAAPASAEIAPPAGEPVEGGIPSFARLYEDYFDFVWCSARRLGVPDATLDDAVQEVFVIVHRRLGESEGRGARRRARSHALRGGPYRRRPRGRATIPRRAPRLGPRRPRPIVVRRFVISGFPAALSIAVISF
jgi:hypothetical protein